MILVRVKPTKIGPFDHAATVTLEVGSKSRTIVREPKLKVEQTVNSAKVLKGQQVEFKIVVQNTGDGPARNVIVQAKLSAGLRHESGEPNGQNLFEHRWTSRSCPASASSWSRSSPTPSWEASSRVPWSRRAPM